MMAVALGSAGPVPAFLSSAGKAREPRASVVISRPDFLFLPCVRVWEHLPDGLAFLAAMSPPPSSLNLLITLGLFRSTVIYRLGSQ